MVFDTIPTSKLALTTSKIRFHFSDSHIQRYVFCFVLQVLGAGPFDEKDPPPIPEALQIKNAPKLSEDEYFDLRLGRMKGDATNLQEAAKSDTTASSVSPLNAPTV